MSIWYELFDRVGRLGRRRWVWLGGPLLLYAWTVTGPFLLDDLHILLQTERYIRGERDRLALFEFAPTEKALCELVDRGSFPWWTPPSLRIAFFRPLAEWSFYADVRMFGRRAVGHRLVSLTLFALALVCLHRLYLSIGANPARAGVATFLLGISQTLSEPVASICNRSDLFVLIGAGLAASAYWSAGARPAWKTVALAVIGFGVALLSKEVSVAFTGVVVAHELLARRRGWQIGGPRVRGYVTLLLSAMAAAYVCYYAATKPAGAALTNWPAVVHLLETFPKSLGLYLAVWTLGFPISVLLISSSLWPGFVLAAAGVPMGVVVLKYVWRLAREEPGVPFFLLWAALFMAPALMTIAEQRALCLATVGWAYLLACLLLPRRDAAPVSPLWLRHWLWTANGIISIFCVVISVGVRVHLERQMQHWLREYQAALASPMRDGDTLLIGQTNFDFEIMLAGDRLEFISGLRNASVSFLTVSGTNAEFVRRDDHTLLVRSELPRLFNSKLHQVALRPHRRFCVGERFRARDFTIEITEVKDNVVRELQVRFNEPLTSPRLHFYPPSLAAIARGEGASRPTSQRAM